MPNMKENMPLPSVEKHSQKFPSRADRVMIAERAYHKWAEAGYPHGDGKEFWFAAEQELTKADVMLEEVLEVEGRGVCLLPWYACL